MSASFFFYDLETSGFSPHAARIMQFAGQRTDDQLQPIGEPVNVLVKLAPDILPDPDAILITGITPQSTQLEGLTEAEFLKYFYDEVVQPNTTFVGFNTIRFDDEFMRFLHYRNFYDPYEWQWQNGCSRWDMLDVVRMTRALRPEGIQWPVSDDGKPTNRLELLTKANGLDHEHAHDALNDVLATIAIAQLIKQKQPDLFDFLYTHRAKKMVAELVLKGQPFVYTSGRYPSSDLHTTAAIMLAKHTGQDAALVYDLRYDPTPFAAMTPEQIIEAWRYKKDRSPDEPRLPVKTLKYNRCPAVAPLGVIKQAEVQTRLGLSLDKVSKNLERLKQCQQELATKVTAALKIMDDERYGADAKRPVTTETVDSLLYDGFIGDADKLTMRAVRVADPAEITVLAGKLTDARLQKLAPLYKARNYPQSLSGEERQAWEAHIASCLFDGGQQSRLAQYFARLQELGKGKPTTEQQYLLEELKLYGESIVPSDMNEATEQAA